MKVLVLVCIALIGAASAGILHHPVAQVIPGAVVHSSRVGGNFAYSTVEGRAVAASLVHHGLLGLHHGAVAHGLHHGALAHGLHHGVVAHGLHHGYGLHHGVHHGVVLG